jgi:septum site-determining protein MinD
MCLILSVYSFRRGTGKSKLIANMAALAGAQGLRVGVVDLNFQSPSIHLLFGLTDIPFYHTFNNYVAKECAIDDCCYDLTEAVIGERGDGRLFLVPASVELATISATLRCGFDMNLINQGLSLLCKEKRLDLLLLDTPAGLGEISLLAQALSDITLIVLRPDKQDYQGTGLMVGVAHELSVPHVRILINEVPPAFSLDEIRTAVENSFDTPVMAVLPYSDEMMALSSSQLFVHHYPNHLITRSLKKTLRDLLALGLSR